MQANVCRLECAAYNVGCCALGFKGLKSRGALNEFISLDNLILSQILLYYLQEMGQIECPLGTLVWSLFFFMRNFILLCHQLECSSCLVDRMIPYVNESFPLNIKRRKCHSEFGDFQK